MTPETKGEVLWTMNDVRKEAQKLWDEYNPTRSGMRENDFKLGVEAALIRSVTIVGEWTKDYTGNIGDPNISLITWWEENTIDAGDGGYYLNGETIKQARPIAEILKQYY